MTDSGIQMNNLYADNQIIKKCEHYLHTAVYKLTQIAKFTVLRSLVTR
jgi:hypothetical protein